MCQLKAFLLRHGHGIADKTPWSEARMRTLRSIALQLPAMNIVIEPSENLIVRVAAAKTIARPNLTALTPGGSIDASPPGLSLTAGNPYLEPIRSNNVDLSVEWYPYDEALFSVALFRKNIESFNQRLLRSIPFSETGFPTTLLPVGVTPDDIFNVTTFVNTPGGVLNGFEVTMQTPFNFEFIPEALTDSAAC
jgi:TonB-dependent receptor